MQDEDPPDVDALVREAEDLKALGRFDEAIARFSALLQREPTHNDALQQISVLMLQRGDWRAAGYYLERSATLDPENAITWANLGVVHSMTGEPQESLRCLDRALALMPYEAQFHNDRANALRRLGRHEEAVGAIERTVALRPDSPVAQFNLGAALAAVGRHADALACFERTLTAQPDFAPAHGMRARSLAAVHRHADAIEALERALRLDPANPAFVGDLGNALFAVGRHAEALRAHVRAVDMQPRELSPLCNLSVTLIALRRFDEARNTFTRAQTVAREGLHGDTDRARLFHLAGLFDAITQRLEEALVNFDRAAALDPGNGVIAHDRGKALFGLARYAQAIAEFDRALTLQPGFAAAWADRAVTLAALRRDDEAMRGFAMALELAPGHADAQFAFALVLLTRGRFGEAWPLFEARWRQPGGEPLRHAGIPAWDGRGGIEGKRVLLWAEQGLGDTLQFCRYAVQLRRMGADVILEVSDTLAPLLRHALTGIDVIASGDPVPPADWQAPLMTVPGLLQIRVDTIVADVPYLRSPPTLVSAWRDRLADGAENRRVGLVVSGNRLHKNDRNRSMPLALLRPLWTRASLVLLQRDLRPEDESELAASPIRDLRNDLPDFAQTAALVECLDLVISVDTSVAHLAGALGKPVWVLLPYLPDWRWMLDRGDSPWYPTARLFRQTEPGDWSGVVARVLAELGA